jgi:hypothetical protein
MAELLKMLVSEGIGFLFEPARERRVVVHEIEIALTRWKNIYANPADAPTPFTILSGPETEDLARRTLTTPKGFGIS